MKELAMLLVCHVGEGEMPSSLPLAMHNRQESMPLGFESGRAGPYPHRLQNSGEQTLPLALAA